MNYIPCFSERLPCSATWFIILETECFFFKFCFAAHRVTLVNSTVPPPTNFFQSRFCIPLTQPYQPLCFPIPFCLQLFRTAERLPAQAWTDIFRCGAISPCLPPPHFLTHPVEIYAVVYSEVYFPFRLQSLQCCLSFASRYT